MKLLVEYFVIYRKGVNVSVNPMWGDASVIDVWLDISTCKCPILRGVRYVDVKRVALYVQVEPVTRLQDNVHARLMLEVSRMQKKRESYIGK